MKGIENYSGLIFKILGALFLLSGLFFYLNADGGLLDIIRRFLAPSSETAIATTVVSNAVFLPLLYAFLPVLLINIGCFYFCKRHYFATSLLSLVSVVFLFFFQNYFYYSILMYWNPDSEYIIPSLALYVPVLLMLAGYKTYKKQVFLYLATLYFYSFILQLYTSWFSFAFTFGSIVLFSLALLAISVKLKHNLINFLNYFAAYFFLLFFVFRKFYLNHLYHFATLFFIVSLLYFVVFFIISGVLAYKEQKLKYVLFNWLNTLSFVLLSCFVLFLIGRAEYYFYPVAVALLSYGIAYYLFLKSGIHQNIFIVELTLLFLTATLFSSFFSSFITVLFLSLNSLLFMVHGKYRNNKLSVYISVIFSVLLALYLAFISTALLPVLVNPVAAGSVALVNGFVYSFIVSATLLGVIMLIKKVVPSLSNKWFVRKKYLVFLNVFLLLHLFLCFEFATLLLLSESSAAAMVYAQRISLIVGCVFLSFLLWFPLKGKEWACYFAYFFAIVFFVMNSFEFPYGIRLSFFVSKFLLAETLLHYSGLLSGGILFVISGYSILNLPKTPKFISRFIQVTGVFMLTAIICREYDFISVLVNYYALPAMSSDQLTEIIVSNQHLPYTFIILLISVLLLLAGTFYKDRFLRLFAIFIIGLSFVKFFVVEFDSLGEGERIASFMTVGGVLLLISSIYTKLKNKERTVRTSRVSSRRK